MGYRRISKPKLERPLLLTVRNGMTLRLSFDLYSIDPQPVHDPHYHDYINWPAPNYHPGAICQMIPPREGWRWFPRPKMVTEDDLAPLNLSAIGDIEHMEALIVFDDSTLPITQETITDLQGDPTNIEIHVTPNINMTVMKPVKTGFTACVKDSSAGSWTELSHGILAILPGGSTTGD